MDAMTFANEAARFDFGAEAEMFSPMGRKARRRVVAIRRLSEGGTHFPTQKITNGSPVGRERRLIAGPERLASC